MNHIFLGFNESQFRSGLPVDGVVIVVLSEETRLHRVSVRWHGMEKVQWVEGLSSEHIKDSRSFLEELFDVWTSTNQEEGDPFSIGTHTFKFSWRCPAKLAQSHEDKIHRSTSSSSTGGAAGAALALAGDIMGATKCSFIVRYLATPLVQTSKELTFADAGTRLIQLAEAFNPMLFQELPVTVNNTKNLFLGGSPITTCLKIPRKTLFTGETIPLTLDIDNSSKKRVEKIVVTLWELAILRAADKVLNQSWVVSSVVLPSEFNVLPKSKRHIQSKFEIPANVKPSVTLGQLVKINYVLEVKLEMGIASSVLIKVPLLLLQRDETTNEYLDSLPKGHDDEVKSKNLVVKSVAATDGVEIVEVKSDTTSPASEESSGGNSSNNNNKSENHIINEHANSSIIENHIINEQEQEQQQQEQKEEAGEKEEEKEEKE